MNIKKPLSLNTQLSKLRLVTRLLRNVLPVTVAKTESGHFDDSRKTLINDIIYSLRDIQYKLRGLKDYNASRSKQLNHYNINEIMEKLNAEITSSPQGIDPNYKATIENAALNLVSVQEYINKKELEKSIEQDELF